MFRKSNILTISVVILLVIILMDAIGCTQPAATSKPVPASAPAPAPVSAPAPAPAPVPASSPAPVPATAPAKVITLRLASQTPPQSDVGVVIQRWADKIKEQSGGRLALKLFFSETLVKQADVFRAVQTGVSDIGYTTIGNDPSLTPLNMVTRLPFIGLPSPITAASIQWDLFKKFPEMQKEYQGMKPLTLAPLPGDQFHFAKKSVRVPADIKGMKVIARGEWPTVMTGMGCAPLSLGVGDWYMSLERGLAEGILVPFVAANAFKLFDVLKNTTTFGEGGGSTTIQIILINMDSWKGLTPELQKILEDTGLWQGDEMVKENQIIYQKLLETLKAKNYNFINIKPEEMKLWADAAKPRHQQWIKDNAAAGPAAQAVYDEAVKLVAKYTK